MVLQVASPNDVKVYHITAGKSIPEWLAKQRSKSLRYDPEWRSRIELLQDFEFPEAALKLKQTADGSHIIAAGVYKPQMRCYDLSQLSMRFDRHMDAETVQMQILSDDWTKLVFLRADRYLELHSQGGIYYKTRVPKFGRDMSYNSQNCDLVVVGASSEAWRLNLDQGRFLNSFQTKCVSLNVCKVHPQHQLTALGSEDGKVEFWDPRVRRCIGTANIGAQVLKQFAEVGELPEISSIRFHNDGLTWGVGTTSGHVLLYDLRADSPILTKDHQYGQPIRDIKFHSSGNVITADTKIIKIWNQTSGHLYTSIEPSTDINDMCVVGSSGVILTAQEEPRMHAYYVPSLGPAPHWCSFLDNLTEELEESKQRVVYDDYKFVTRKELQSLGLDHLLGTPMLRAYMHGFFMDQRLYQKAQAIANPFLYDEYKKRVVEEQVAKENTSRISLQRRLPKVNKQVAERLIQQRSVADPSAQVNSDNPLGDERFKAMFENPEFNVDMESNEYRLLHPTLKSNAVKSHFQRINDDDADSDVDAEEEPEGKGSDESSDDSDDDLATQVRKKQRTQDTSTTDQPKDTPSSSKKQPNHHATQQKGVSFYELQEGGTAKTVLEAGDAKKQQQHRQRQSLAFGERLQYTNGNNTEETAREARSTLGPVEYRFNLSNSKPKTQNVNSGNHNIRDDRRSIKELRLPRGGGGGRGRGGRGGRGGGGGRGGRSRGRN